MGVEKRKLMNHQAENLFPVKVNHSMSKMEPSRKNLTSNSTVQKSNTVLVVLILVALVLLRTLYVDLMEAEELVLETKFHLNSLQLESAPKILSKSKESRSTCSPETKKHGPGQKVVAYSYYEKSGEKLQRDYFGGIKKNLETVKKFYPEFRVRLYVEIPKSSSNYNKLEQLRVESLKKGSNLAPLDVCDIAENPLIGNGSRIHPMVWRWLPALDSDV